jgi:hypothetical protein
LCCTLLYRKVVRQSYFWSNFVMILDHQSLAFSGFMGLSRQLGTLRKKTRSNHDISDLQVGALERRPSSRLGIPSWMIIQNVYSQSEHISSPAVLNSLKSDIFLIRVSSCCERSKSHAGLTAWPMYSTFSGPWG